ncbi:DUF58 domain-containing protein [Taibaiella sp. KBW10]|uniref:DUF58 domain-containing protein n=1 Tax=Taibaiella sp. KBW10 TaxID=2153357 RepID=UPI000F5997B4|nr:DUF58 domain-containing protein [Taibaiella sp. KBW10]RQO31525.1 DUF58 domain-containing protein [Taibaiella sp. KBW10]
MKNLFIHYRWFITLAVTAMLFFTAFFIPFLWYVAMGVFCLFMVLSLLDLLLLFGRNRKVTIERKLTDRWHLGEENTVYVQFENHFGYKVFLELIDEVPVQFQARNFIINRSLATDEKVKIQYELKPLSRGIFTFGHLIAYVATPIQFFKRKMVNTDTASVKVYPTTKYIKNYQLLAISDKNNLIGTKKIRRLGHSLEFEQIKDYVNGDDIRTINWNATARRNHMMVNTFTDIRSQLIYCLIDKGRNMKMPFEGMTLMDYAIKSSLTFLNIALHRHDKVGLITFSSGVNDIIPAEHNSSQMSKILETLYHQQTDFLDADYEKLLTVTRYKLSQRSFLMLFTNFESLTALERQMPYLRGLAKRHMLCVVFFENTAIKHFKETQPDTTEGIYVKTIADRFDYEKKQMVKELRRYGIISILTTPDKLTVDVVNNYLELKSRQSI